MTCVPAFAPSTSDGSASDGIVASRIGDSLQRPYFVASKARSIASMPGATTIRPRSSASSPPAAGNDGQLLQREVDLGHDAGRPDVAGAPAERRPERHGVEQVEERALGSAPETTALASISVAVGEDHAGRAPVAGGDARRPRRRSRSRRRRLAPPRRAPRRARPGRPSRRPSRRPRRRRCRRCPRAASRPSRPTTARPPRSARRATRAPPERHPTRRTRRRGPRRPSAGRAAPSAIHPDPRPLKVRPRRSAEIASARRGDLMSGGVDRPSSSRNLPSRADALVEAGVRRRVVLRPRRAGPPRSCRTSLQSVTAVPSGDGANTRTSGATSDRPWPREAQVALDRRPQSPDRVRQRRDADALGQLRRVGRAADPLAALEDERAQARLRRGTPR